MLKFERPADFDVKSHNFGRLAACSFYVSKMCRKVEKKYLPEAHICAKIYFSWRMIGGWQLTGVGHDALNLGVWQLKKNKRPAAQKRNWNLTLKFERPADFDEKSHKFGRLAAYLFHVLKMCRKVEKKWLSVAHIWAKSNFSWSNICADHVFFRTCLPNSAKKI